MPEQNIILCNISSLNDIIDHERDKKSVFGVAQILLIRNSLLNMKKKIKLFQNDISEYERDYCSEWNAFWEWKQESINAFVVICLHC